jgi:hypothetical protein
MTTNIEQAMSAERTRAYREQIEDERQQRIEEHHREISAAEVAAGPRPLNIYADGDSWFDYPLPVLNPRDVIVSVKKRATVRPLILNLAHHGDEARDAMGVSQRERVIKNLRDPANGKFEAILFSGGGNDTAGDQFVLWLYENADGRSPGQAINVNRLGAVLGVVRSAYEDLFEIRDRFAPQCWVFVYAYDWPIPDGRGVCGVGPWLKPSLEFRGWNDSAVNVRIVKEFLRHLDSLLRQLAAAHKNIVYVPTQGTLSPTDWANELHPTPDGFDKIGDRFLAAMRPVFPGRI